MNRVLFLSLSILCMLIASACTYNTEPINGTYAHSEKVDIAAGIDAVANDTICFSNDSIVTYSCAIIMRNDNGECSASVTATGTWSIEGDSITLNYPKCNISAETLATGDDKIMSIARDLKKYNNRNLLPKSVTHSISRHSANSLEIGEIEYRKID